MIVGFTGTQRGMTRPQVFAVVRDLVSGTSFPNWVQHGDCMGSDEEFHAVCLTFGISIGIRPCNIEAKRAHCKILCSGWVAPPMPPLHRNIQMVASVNKLIATPAQPYEYQRSGTWATIRAARKRKKRDVLFEYVVFGPDGEAIEEKRVV